MPISDQKSMLIQDDNAEKIKSSTSSSKISSKSKKEDILLAYEELSKKFQDNAEKAGSKKTEIQRREENNLLEVASKFSMDLVLGDISTLEGEIKKLLGKLSESLIQEVKKFQDLQEAIKVEQKRLEEIHGISVEADTLADLIQAAKDKKDQLEAEYQKLEEALKKELENKKEQWRREQDEYNYQLQLKRRKEEAEYEEGRILKEKELHEREAVIKATEEELKELRKLKTDFDKKLSEQLEQAKLQAEEKARQEEETKAHILAEKTAAEKQIAQLTIKSLEKKIIDQEEDISRLKKELEVANRGVKDIAIKVIEGDGRRAENRRQLKSYQTETEKEEKFTE